MLSESPAASSQAMGAYGLALPLGFFPAHRLIPVDSDAAVWEFRSTAEGPAPTASTVDLTRSSNAVLDGSSVDAHGATVDFIDGTLTIDRGTQRAEFRRFGRVDPELLTHPVLAALGIAAAHWAGRVPLHAGAVIVHGRAWGLMADRGVGKSTTTAALDRAGHGVVTDDVLIIDGQLRAHAGPRCVDLRASSAGLFPDAKELTTDPRLDRGRYRIDIGPVPATVPFAGFIRLEWSDDDGVHTTPVRPVDRLSLIGHAYSVSAPMANPLLSLDLAALPMFVLARPKRLDAMDRTIDALLSVTASAG